MITISEGWYVWYICCEAIVVGGAIGMIFYWLITRGK